MTNFNQYSQYYDLLYKEKDYITESIYVYDTLKALNPNLNSILELGCGSGNHAMHLTQNNLVITGIERSQTMVTEAENKKIRNFNPILGDIAHFELNQNFDAVISLFHVVSYLTDNEALIGCFESVHKHLKNNGLFLFDIWFTPAVYNQKPETRVRRLENDDIRVIRIAESDSNCQKNVVDVNFEVHITNKNTQKTTILNEKHPMRHFSIPELKLLASLTGFELIHTEEFLTKKDPSDQTWGVCVILKKKIINR